jgi:hypothetical protein
VCLRAVIEYLPPSKYVSHEKILNRYSRHGNNNTSGKEVNVTRDVL